MRKIISGVGELALSSAVISVSTVAPASAGIVGAAAPGLGISHVIAFVVGLVIGAVVVYFIRRNR
jgi:hypothetical protein